MLTVYLLEELEGGKQDEGGIELPPAVAKTVQEPWSEEGPSPEEQEILRQRAQAKKELLFYSLFLASFLMVTKIAIGGEQTGR